MTKIDLFIFDLDGTLIDSKRDIAGSVNFTMKEIGLAPLPEEIIYSFVGNGVTPLIRQMIRQTVETAGGSTFEKALTVFLKHYEDHCLDTTRPFPEIVEVLRHFSPQRKVVVTNKSQGFSEKILKGLGMDLLLDGIFGGDTPFPKKPAPDIVLHLVKKFGAAPDRTVLVGDSRVDMETGKNAGILTCGVTWGFRPRQELEEIGCAYLIDQPKALIKLFR